MSEKKGLTAKKRVLIVLLVVLLLIAGVGGCYYWRTGRIDADAYKIESSETVSDETSETLATNPIDFATLQAENPDICAWITVPNTNIDYPILQSSYEDDDYYIDHDQYGNYSVSGAIYIQRLNNNHFTDRNTVIYGHNMKNGTMFRTLHYFREEDFFNENETFTIYTPGHILTYEIFSAYRYDDRHILNSFDFTDTAVFAEYLAYATNPTSLIKNVREGVSVTTDDKIVTLSTCTSESQYRYLVQGVLINDEPTA